MTADGPDFYYESQHDGLVAGVDEAGRGPWAGPVVAAAVILPRDNLPTGINDSKKLTAARREDLCKHLHTICTVGVGIASVEEIDALNILQASLLAMHRAIASLEVLPCIALIDGNKIPSTLSCRAQAIVKGDGKCLSIAAASIIAKVTRDKIMTQLAETYPHYGWERNAGYGTVAHQRGLTRYGITPHHRRSFAPIKALMEQAA